MIVLNIKSTGVVTEEILRETESDSPSTGEYGDDKLDVTPLPSGTLFSGANVMLLGGVALRGVA